MFVEMLYKDILYCNYILISKLFMPKTLDAYINSLKYRNEMQILEVNYGAGLNTMVNEIVPHIVFRFVYKDAKVQSHLPPYKKNPRRTLPGQGRKIEIEGYALSCIESAESAQTLWNRLNENFCNIRQSVGDALAQGNIDIADGVVDEVDEKFHFNLYEFDCCDLGSKFVIIKQLI